MNDTTVETVDVDKVLAEVQAETDAPEVVEETTEAVDAPAEDEATETPDDAPDGEAVEAAQVVEAPPEPVYEPFTFNAFKQPYEVQGLQFDKQSLTIKAESPQAIERVKQMLAQGREWEARGRQELVALRKEVQAGREMRENDPDKVAAQAYLNEWRELMTMPEEQLAQFIINARMEWPKIEAKADRAVAERMRQQAQQMQQAPEPDVEAVVQHAQAGAGELVQELLADQPWANPDIAQEITEYLQDLGIMDQWVLRATRDMPEHGIRAGQYVANWDKARELAERLLNPYRRAFAQTATVQKQAAQTTKIAQQNAAALAQAKPVAKKPVPAAPKPAPAPSTQKSSSDARAALMKDVWDTWKDVKRAR